MLLLKKYWFEIMIVVGALVVLGYIKYLVNENGNLEKDKQVLQAEKAQYVYALKFQNSAILQNKSDYDEAIKKLPTVVHDINTKYKTQYETIYAWRDHNETHDCNSSMQYLNTYQF